MATYFNETNFSKEQRIKLSKEIDEQRNLLKRNTHCVKCSYQQISFKDKIKLLEELYYPKNNIIKIINNKITTNKLSSYIQMRQFKRNKQKLDFQITIKPSFQMNETLLLKNIKQAIIHTHRKNKIKDIPNIDIHLCYEKYSLCEVMNHLHTTFYNITLNQLLNYVWWIQLYFVQATNGSVKIEYNDIIDTVMWQGYLMSPKYLNTQEQSKILITEKDIFNL